MVTDLCLLVSLLFSQLLITVLGRKVKLLLGSSVINHRLVVVLLLLLQLITQEVVTKALVCGAHRVLVPESALSVLPFHHFDLISTVVTRASLSFCQLLDQRLILL